MRNFDNLPFEAVAFARQVHAGQVRKYTLEPYVSHLAEVAGIVSTIDSHPASLAVAWLHDTMEDCAVTFETLQDSFGTVVAMGVRMLSDLEPGNRAARKAAARARLADAPSWVQNIKVADLISNTPSIVRNDPKFASTYLEEKRLLLDVLIRADFRLVRVAREIV